MKSFLLALLILFSNIQAEARPVSQPLEADQAFEFSLIAKDNQTLIAQWDIAPGYYLYRARIHINAINPECTQFAPLLMPEGRSKTDPELGHYQVYEKNLSLLIPILHSTEPFITLKVEYQGCSEKGYCYPPVEKIVRVNTESHYFQPAQLLSIDLAPKPTTSINTQDKITQLLSAGNFAWTLLVFLGLGILLSLTPCILPMIPILSSIILGQKNLTPRHSLLLSFSYVLAMALTYAVIGIVFGLIGSNAQSFMQTPWMIGALSLLFVAMALSLFGLYELRLPAVLNDKIQDLSRHQRGGSYISAALMGVFATLIVSPCVTAPLVGVLGFISQSGSVALGGSALFVMGLGMGLPLMIIGATGGRFFLKAGPWMNQIKRLLGVLMLAVALSLLARILSPLIMIFLWALLAISTGVLLGAVSSSSNRAGKISKGIGLVFFVYGIALALNGLVGNTDPLRPFALKNQHSASALHFISVKTPSEVQEQVDQAQGKPVLLDFYADWCVACKLMDRTTFSDPSVQKRLSSWVILRADVTANDAQDTLLSKTYQVVAPPTLVFFNREGKYLPHATAVGEISATELLEVLNTVEQDQSP